jgi:hypothetical protein
MKQKTEIERYRRLPKLITVVLLDGSKVELGLWNPLKKIELSIAEFINDGIRCNAIDEANISMIDFVF